MKRIREILHTKISVFSVILILTGLVSLLVGFTPTGIPFLFQLFALFCFALLIFVWSVILSTKPGKFQKIAKVLKWTIIVAFLVLLISFLVVEYHILQNHNGDDDIPESAQIVIVLGCKVNGEVPSLMLRYRLEAALERLEESPDSIAVLCGGQGVGEDISEAEAMRRWLVDRGIDESRLMKEDQSENTRQNVRNAAEILGVDGENSPQAVVVTTGFHLFRSKRICNSEGFEAYGIAAKMPEIPFFHLNYYCREFASVVKMYLQEIFA